MEQRLAGVVRERVKAEERKGQAADQELNLKGKICPYTFIESMLALEEMEVMNLLMIMLMPTRFCGSLSTIRPRFVMYREA